MYIALGAHASAHYSEGADIEHLLLERDVFPQGNILKNAGIGHNGTNVINGGGSADMPTGGQGNDAFGAAFAVLIALCAGYPPHTSSNSRSY